VILPSSSVWGCHLRLVQWVVCLWSFHSISASLRVIGVLRLAIARLIVAAAIAVHAIPIGGRTVIISMVFRLV